MNDLRYLLRERADDALSLVFAFVVVFAAANLLYAAKCLAGIDLLPDHSGSLFPAGQGIYQALSGR